jgi:type IX secretion system PorP/SprF family membrane protein
MRKTLTLLALLMMGTSIANAQQDPMFTNYLFNALTFNPAYAGSSGHMVINALHRSQWVGIEGAPTTQSLTLHTPLKSERVGVGFSFVNDKIGATNSMNLNGAYAYRIPVGKGKLAIGLQGSINTFQADWSKLTYSDGIAGDPAFQGDTKLVLKPNFGAGIYYSTKHFYMGAAVPRIIEHDLTQNRVDQLPFYAKQYRHTYFTLGAAIPLKGDALVFKPSLLVKSAALDSRFKSTTDTSSANFSKVGAPTQFNVDLSLFFNQTLWIGSSFRSSVEAFTGKDDASKSSFDSVDFWAAYYLASGLRLGVAYDYSLTKIQTKSAGSFEIMAGWEFDYRVKRVVTPRYF